VIFVFMASVEIPIVAYRPITRQRQRNKETTAITRQQLLKYATVLKPLLGSGPRATMEVLLETVLSIG
jgi:hypothetical protein